MENNGAITLVKIYNVKKEKIIHKDKLGNIGENKLLLITTIKLIDEYFNLKEKVTNQKANEH